MTITQTELAQARQAISTTLFADETERVTALIDHLGLSPHEKQKIATLAHRLVTAVRSSPHAQGSLDSFMQQYALSSEEGVVLMCMAEALLRIPDAATADRLIADKIGGKDWQAHIGQSDSLFVNASAWGLMLTGKFIGLSQAARSDTGSYLKRLISRSGEPVVRSAMRQAMRIMGKQFVLGRTIEEAIKNSAAREKEGYRFSYDMLGEAAFTAEDASRYFNSYVHALKTLGQHEGEGNLWERPSISIKLSALHPRYEEKQKTRVREELLPKLLALCHTAKNLSVGLTIDAEEVFRLELSLDLFEALARDEALKGWDGLGLAVQAYSKRAMPLLQWLNALAVDTGRKIPVRLVKGAYWDTEIKRAQEAGLEAYPVFTRKLATDISYLACARYLLANRSQFYPQFATHNAHTVAAIQVMAEGDKNERNERNQNDFEFQRLHGMGQALYEQVITAENKGLSCRIYAPVGAHEDLLAYLVRRILENGANTSFVNRLADEAAPIAEIIQDPVAQIKQYPTISNPRIHPPQHMFEGRIAATGYPLWHQETRESLKLKIQTALAQPVVASTLINGESQKTGARVVINSPHNNSCVVGEAYSATDHSIIKAMQSAGEAQAKWDKIGGADRASILEKAASLYEAQAPALLALLIREAGKTYDNAVADLREAVDFLRYYARQAKLQFNGPQILPGPTGEHNQMSLHGRGVFAAISPWNFPLAIFTGQIAAGLAAGNSVVAKPAEQTPLIAYQAVKLLHEAGVPVEALHLIIGEGARVGKILLAHPALAGVVFTGSNETATLINRSLAAREGALVSLLAETGGMNAMIVDSSALPEQAVRDVLASAFDSAGQRCSAARILFVQEDIAEKLIHMLKGAMAELQIGDPLDYKTDIGPVIDHEAKDMLEAHKQRMSHEAKVIMDLPLPLETKMGTYVAPAAYEIPDLSLLHREVFGPILHVVRFSSHHIAKVCAAINATGFGLTLGLHTRIEATAREVQSRVRVGNIYVNRNQIGALVEAQPFGGQGLSGTGPKAGGPHYLQRFATERVVSTDTTAAGGNAALMSLETENEAEGTASLESLSL